MSLPASSANRTVDVVNASGAKAGTAELPAELFDVTANIPLIHQVVVAQLAAARQGTHSTKGRGEVRGGGEKPYRQKGTGRARQGSIRAPQYVGGGTVHGPRPRGYAQRTPKKMIVAALRAVTDSDKVLVVLHRDEDLAWLSLRNAVSLHAIAIDQLNAYDVLVNDEVVFTSAALTEFVAGPVSEPPAAPVSDPKVPSEPDNTEPDEVGADPDQTHTEPAGTSAEPVDIPSGPSPSPGSAATEEGEKGALTRFAITATSCWDRE